MIRFLVFESFVILPYVRPTYRPKCLVMHLNGLEWFCGYPPQGITCSGGNSSISIFGSGSKWLFVVFIFWYQNQGYWMNDNKVMVANRHLTNN